MGNINNYSERRALAIFYLFYTISNIIILISISSVSYSIWLKIFSVLLLFFLLSIFLVFKKINGGIFSLSGITILMLFFLHFGQVLIKVFFPDYVSIKSDSFIDILNPLGMKNALIFSILILHLLVLGIIIFSKKSQVLIKKKNEVKYIRTKSIGWIFVILCFPIQVYLDLKKINFSIDEGYMAVFENVSSGYITEIASLSFVGFALLLLAYSKEKRKVYSIFLFINVYLIFTMLSGSRGMQLSLLILYIYLFHNAVQKINIKKVFLLILFALFLLALVTSISVFRDIEQKSIFEFFNIFLDSLKSNPLVAFVFELGGTIQTVYQVIRQIPVNLPFAKGMTYFDSMLSVFPNIGEFMHKSNEAAHFVKSLNGAALGGSLIGELYFNFGYFSFIVAPFIGGFINTISQKMDTLIKNRDFYKVGYYIPLFTSIIWWTRDAFISIPRHFVIVSLCLYLLNLFIQAISYNEKDYIVKVK